MQPCGTWHPFSHDPVIWNVGTDLSRREGMHRERPVVLVAGVRRSSVGELAPVLDRQNLTVLNVTSYEDAVMYANAARVELIILGTGTDHHEPPTGDPGRSGRNHPLPEWHHSWCWPQPDHEDNARQLIGHGVNRVMLNGRLTEVTSACRWPTFSTLLHGRRCV